MKKLLPILLILFFKSSVAFSQGLSKQDSLALIEAVEIVFFNSEFLDFKNFQKISTDEIKCIFISGSLVASREQFFQKFFSQLKYIEEWERVKNSQLIFQLQESHEISVSFDTVTDLDYSEGKEVLELILYFKEVDGTYKLSGMDLSPL